MDSREGDQLPGQIRDQEEIDLFPNGQLKAKYQKAHQLKV
jgi:hypothetical protein